MIINLPKKLSYLDIYDKIPQELIYSHYLGSPIKEDKLFRCCFHKDNSPSLGFYKSNSGNIRYKCFGCDAEGGCIEFVMNLLNIPYPKALSRIQDDLLKNEGSVEFKSKIGISTQEFKYNPTGRVIILPTFRSFELYDAQYWNSYHLSLLDVLKAKIKACDKVYYINKDGEYKLLCYNSKDNPVYCIEISKGIYKIYRPKNPTKKGKWFSNSGSEDMQGLSLISDKRDLLLITSSMKDALVLYKLGYQAIAPVGEGVRIPDKVWDWIKATSKEVIYFNDADEAGYLYTKKMTEERGESSIFIPKSYNIKDISDFVKEFGLDEAKILMNKLIDEVVNGENG